MIRPANLHDLEGLVALEAGFPEGDRFDRRTWRRLLGGRTITLVYGPANALTGAAVVLLRRGAGTARLYSIIVARAARGTGIGGRLLGACEAAASAQGRDRMRLEVRSTNTSAIRLYETHGYRVIARIESYYPDGEEALRMEKPLIAPANGAP